MPIYEYECDQQGHRFEKWQSIQDEPLRICPTCGSPVHKVFHPTSIIFKGSGWYVNDSRKSSGEGDSGTSTTHSTSSKPSTESKGTTEKKDGGSEKKE